MLGQAIEVAVRRPHHDWHFSEVDAEGVEVAIDFSGDLGEQRSGVGLSCESALLREDLLGECGGIIISVGLAYSELGVGEFEGLEGEIGRFVGGQLWQDVLFVEFHGHEAVEDLLQSAVRDEVEGLDVVLGSHSQFEALLIVHYIHQKHTIYDNTHFTHRP